MLKKHFRDLYLIGISFVAGVLFVVQCGGAAKSIAEAVAEALDINFTNSDTSLEATDVQTALSELDARFPVVFDANNVPIGVLMRNHLTERHGYRWEVWSPTYQTFFSLNPFDGAIIFYSEESSGSSDHTHLYYESSDCTGDPFMAMSKESLLKIVDTYYVPHNRGRYLSGGIGTLPTEILSVKDNTGTCSADAAGAFTSSLKVVTINSDDLKTTLIEAKELALPDYVGPLSFGRDTST